MVKFLAVISLAAAVACVRADGLIGAPAAIFGAPAIRTLEPALPSLLSPVVPHLLPSRIATQIVHEQVAVPLHRGPVFDVLPTPILPAPILPAPILPAPILPAPLLPAPIFPAPIVSPLPTPIFPAPILSSPILPAPIPDVLPARFIPARTYGVPAL